MSDQPLLPGFDDDPAPAEEARTIVWEGTDAAAGLPLFEDAGGDGAMLDTWRSERQAAFAAACAQLGAPLHREVEVTLLQGPVLRGRLCLAEEELWVEPHRDTIVLCVGAATFRLGEIESMVTL